MSGAKGGQLGAIAAVEGFWGGGSVLLFFFLGPIMSERPTVEQHDCYAPNETTIEQATRARRPGSHAAPLEPGTFYFSQRAMAGRGSGRGNDGAYGC